MPLPLLPGLLDEALDNAVRARQRRVWVASNDRFDLRALTAAEEPIERAIVATRLYGQHAKDLIDQRLRTCDTQDVSGWRFLRLAHSLQVGSQDASLLAEQYVGTDTQAVRDAYWHFPVEDNIFTVSTAHLLPLFKSTDQAVRAMAVELAGRLGDKSAEPLLIDNIASGRQVAHNLLALARLGRIHERHALMVQQNLDSPHELVRAWAVEVALTLGCADWLKPWRDLTDLQHPPVPASTLTWCAWAALEPRAAADAAVSATGLPLWLRMRIIALTGYPDALVAAMALIARDPEPTEPFAADVLHLVLGTVPMEAKVTPHDAKKKSATLRHRLLQVLRESHVPIQNDAETAEWDAAAILQPSQESRSVRIRGGRRLVLGTQMFPTCLPEVTHPLREWIYRERALLSGRPVSLSAWDAARRQTQAATMAVAVAEIDGVDLQGIHG